MYETSAHGTCVNAQSLSHSLSLFSFSLSPSFCISFDLSFSFSLWSPFSFFFFSFYHDVARFFRSSPLLLTRKRILSFLFFYLPLTLFFPPFFLIPTAQRYPRSATLGNEACAHVCAYTTRTRDIASWYLLLLHACAISVLLPSLSIPLTLFAPTPPRCFHFPPLSLSFYRVTRETRSRCSSFVSFFGERPTPMRESATPILIVLYVRDIRTYTRVRVRLFLASFRARENARAGSNGCLTRTKWIWNECWVFGVVCEIRITSGVWTRA